MRLPGPVRGAIAPWFSYLLVLTTNSTKLSNLGVHESKLPAKTAETSKSFESAELFFFFAFFLRHHFINSRIIVVILSLFPVSTK